MHDSKKTLNNSDWIAKVQAFVLEQFNKRQDNRLLVHNYAFAAELAEKAATIAWEENADDETHVVVALTAWLYPIGYLFDYFEPLPYSLEAATRLLTQEFHTEENVRNRVIQLLQQLQSDKWPLLLEGRILNDAIMATTYLSGKKGNLALLRAEKSFFEKNGKDHTPALLDELLHLPLHTHYARTHYQPVLAQAIRECKLELDKGQLVAPENHRLYDLEQNLPLRGIQTYFRTNYRNHINLSAIADNKANIMISVNAILISVLITFLSYHNIGQTKPQIILPVLIFLVTGLASLIFAVLSARPKVTMLHVPGQAPQEVRKNILFFGNFVHLELPEYEEAMESLFNDSELLYGNMIRDTYYLGKVLDKKYRYLSVSYNVFMIGFIATVIAFLITLFA
ncbi:MAG TPA: DUF5706 domain-containing protein [Saprospiraceae bacterium]|nr:DUF5706 domain-containing protein [Saprospiraceae bacterium]HMQ82967.1 DUF5706 domain-containing protein [Saprospiraceae bacterium]